MASAPSLEGESNVVNSPSLPYCALIPGGLFAGRAVVLTGMVHSEGNSEGSRFYVDLCCGLLISGDHMDNKALHCNPRFDKPGGWFSGDPDRALVLNSLVNNTWGQEERYTNPFAPGQPFQIRILCLENYYKIAVNGAHLCDFAHRVPLSMVRTVSVGGCIRLDKIEYQPALNSIPGREELNKPRSEVVTKVDKPVMPLSFPLAAGFSAGSLHFTLTPFMSAKRFSLNLHYGPEYFFHFRVDFTNGNDKAVVVRNSTFQNGTWLEEERQMGRFPFNKGITSDIVFTATSSSVNVSVDGDPFIRFAYRGLDCPSRIDRVTVDGDCIVQRLLHKHIV